MTHCILANIVLDSYDNLTLKLKNLLECLCLVIYVYEVIGIPMCVSSYLHIHKAICSLERKCVGVYYPSPSNLLLLTSTRKSHYQLSCLHENPSNASKVLRLPISNYKLQNTNFGVNQSENQCVALILTGGH